MLRCVLDAGAHRDLPSAGVVSRGSELAHVVCREIPPRHQGNTQCRIQRGERSVKPIAGGEVMPIVVDDLGCQQEHQHRGSRTPQVCQGMPGKQRCGACLCRGGILARLLLHVLGTSESNIRRRRSGCNGGTGRGSWRRRPSRRGGLVGFPGRWVCRRGRIRRCAGGWRCRRTCRRSCQRFPRRGCRLSCGLRRRWLRLGRLRWR